MGGFEVSVEDERGESGMLIRSQDKTYLIHMDGLEIFIFEKEIKVSRWVDHSYVIGAYSTREKALKVLDMIQDYYTNTINSRCRVFQMPQDSEVEA
jgi:hypothetical protein